MTPWRDDPKAADGEGPASPLRLRGGGARPGARAAIVVLPVALLRESKGPRVRRLAADGHRDREPRLPGHVITGLDAAGRYLAARSLGIMRGPGCGQQRQRKRIVVLGTMWFALIVVTLVAMLSR